MWIQMDQFLALCNFSRTQKHSCIAKLMNRWNIERSNITSGWMTKKKEKKLCQSLFSSCVRYSASIQHKDYIQLFFLLKFPLVFHLHSKIVRPLLEKRTPEYNSIYIFWSNWLSIPKWSFIFGAFDVCRRREKGYM